MVNAISVQPSALCHAEAEFLNPRRLGVEIRGAVQGVGFRPFVYRLATDMGLTGWIVNDTAGVSIEVEGPEDVLERFLQHLVAEPPPRAVIQELRCVWMKCIGYGDFSIRHSDNRGAKTVLVLPDIAICPKCLSEILNPTDRRCGYPFTNCTDCGPRFSIIEALPYDRPNTTMHRFTMCPDCQREYGNPLDRRFHAQPNACAACGPQIEYMEPVHARTGEALPRQVVRGEPALRRAAEALRMGRIVAVKGLGGFHLMVDAGNAEAVSRLRARKHRGDKPFAIMVRDLNQARLLCDTTPEAEALLTGPESPIVLLSRRLGVVPRPSGPEELSVVDGVAPGNPRLGIMLPYTPLHHLLLREVGVPVVATSGNLADEPICTDNDEALNRLGRPSPGSATGLADAFLLHDRPIARHVDDSVAWIVAGAPRLLRRSRGYAPLPILLAGDVPPILAVGGHLKNTISLSVGRQVFVSQHIGDLETPQAMAAFERVIADFVRLYEAAPVAIAHDMHPDYLSTKWAQEQIAEAAVKEERHNAEGQGGKGEEKSVIDPSGWHASASTHLIAVSHHHAHLAACLAENQVTGPALGITWDGTGYGPDGTVWGGEFLTGDAAGYVRVAHLRPFRLPGGDAAVHEPRRAALALLWELYGEDALTMTDLAPVAAFSLAERKVLARMLNHGINAPVTTSAGRLFDGISALAGLDQRVAFEGQAAMALEFAAGAGEHGAYPIDVVESFPLRSTGALSSDYAGFPQARLLDWQPMIESILDDLRHGCPVGTISARFHAGLVGAILRVAQVVGQPKVALTGGCFQNRLLTERAVDKLECAGFEVLLHRQVPPNDGCISLGQVAIAAARLAGSQYPRARSDS